MIGRVLNCFFCFVVIAIAFYSTFNKIKKTVSLSETSLFNYKQAIFYV